MSYGLLISSAQHRSYKDKIPQMPQPHSPTKLPQMMHQLVTLFNDMLQEVKREHDVHTEQIRTEWKNIEIAKRSIVMEREQFEQEHRAFHQEIEKERERLGILLRKGEGTPERVSSTHLTPNRQLASATGVNPRNDVYSRLQNQEKYTVVPNPSVAKRSPRTTPRNSPARNEQATPRSFNHAKNFSATPPRKYGMQVEGPFWITVWPGLERHGHPTRVLLQSYRTMQQVIEKACKETKTQPQPNVLYTPDGRTVANLADVRPGLDYLVIPSGTMYREDSVPTALLKKLVTEGEAISDAVSQIQWSANHISPQRSRIPKGSGDGIPGGSEIPSDR